MEAVVLDKASSVVTANELTGYVSQSSTEVLVADNNTTSFITIESGSNVLVEVNSSSLIVQGQIGPPGKDGIAEEDMVYSKRIDFVSDNEIYRGEAQVGSVESSNVWRIRRITIASDNDVTEMWAGGTAEFNKAWSNRVNYSYS